jgi:cytochrome c553
MLRPLLLMALLSLACTILPSNAASPPAVTRSNYLLGCGGCHGYEGVSNSRLVPTLKGLVGYYLNTAEGRDYLPRLPNVAFSTLSDQELAAVLNYLVFDLGESSAPRGARPYAAAEVGRLRKRPLTEIALHPYRRQLVDALISRYQASDALRVYDVNLY